MRIWIIHQHAIPSIITGPTRHFDLAKKLIEQGHEVFIFAGNFCHTNFFYIAEPYSKTKKISYYSKVPFIWFAVPRYKGNSIKRIWNMLVFAYKVISSKDLRYLPKPDVILGSSPSPFAAFVAQKLAKRFQVPFVYEIRDLWPKTLLSLGSFSKYHPLILIMQKIETSLLNKAAKIISVLPGMDDYLIENKMAREKLIWLPNAVDTDKIIYQSPSARDTLTIFYAGSFNISNDVATLLHAAKILQTSANNKFYFKLVGEGPLKIALQEIVRTEKIDNIEFLPTVTKEKIYTLLSSADLCVGMVKKTNLYRYGTSLNKISDYLAVARPIIFALDSPYSPITEANAGYTVEPENPQKLAEAILKLASLPFDERQQLGMNGRKYAEQHFNLNKIATGLIDQLSIVA